MRSVGAPRQPRHSGVSGLEQAWQSAASAGGTSPPDAQPPASPATTKSVEVKNHAGNRIERMDASCVYALQVASNLSLSYMVINVDIYSYVGLYRLNKFA